MRIEYHGKGIGPVFPAAFHSGKIFTQFPKRAEDRIVYKIAYIIIFKAESSLRPHEGPLIGTEIIL